MPYSQVRPSVRRGPPALLKQNAEVIWRFGAVCRKWWVRSRRVKLSPSLPSPGLAYGRQGGTVGKGGWG